MPVKCSLQDTVCCNGLMLQTVRQPQAALSRSLMLPREQTACPAGPGRACESDKGFQASQWRNSMPSSFLCIRLPAKHCDPPATHAK